MLAALYEPTLYYTLAQKFRVYAGISEEIIISLNKYKCFNMVIIFAIINYIYSVLITVRNVRLELVIT